MATSIENSLIQFLSATAEITAVAGTNPVRIVPVSASQGLAFPRLVVRKTSDEPTYASGGEVGPGQARFLLECQGEGIAQAQSLRNPVRDRLSGYQGAMGSRRCSACFIRDEFDDDAPSVHGGEQGIKSKTLEIELHYS